MRRLTSPPKVQHLLEKIPFVNDWFATVTERFTLYRGASNPVLAEVPQNQWILYYNTTLSELRLWANLDGVLVRSYNLAETDEVPPHTHAIADVTGLQAELDDAIKTET